MPRLRAGARTLFPCLTPGSRSVVEVGLTGRGKGGVPLVRGVTLPFFRPRWKKRRGGRLCGPVEEVDSVGDSGFTSHNGHLARAGHHGVYSRCLAWKSYYTSVAERGSLPIYRTKLLTKTLYFRHQYIVCHFALFILPFLVLFLSYQNLLISWTLPSYFRPVIYRFSLTALSYMNSKNDPHFGVNKRKCFVLTLLSLT